MVEYCLYELDLQSPDGTGWYTNGNWIDSIDRNHNIISKGYVMKHALQLLKQNNCPAGNYNIDIIRGPKKIVQDSDFYECCIGYANIRYDRDAVNIIKMEIN